MAVTMAAAAPNAFAQMDWKTYGLFQVGVTTGAAQDPRQAKLAIGADFGQVMNRWVDVYLSGGWQEEAPVGVRDTGRFTGGVKLMLTDTFVRPYVLAGVGVMHFRPLQSRLQLPEALDVDGKNKFLGEVGAGLAFPVGSHGYIDAGYRYFNPYNGPADFAPHGVFAGFGFRY